MAYWLMKSEPEAYSFDDLYNEENHTTYWDGVRNYQARNMLRDQIKTGDSVFFYHSNCKPPGIIGITKVTKDGYVDFNAFNPESKYYDPKSHEDKPRWYMVDITFQRHLKRFLSLDELRENPALANMQLLQKGNRLSVLPVSEDEWEAILDMEAVT